MSENISNKMPLGQILKSALRYCLKTPKQSFLFCLVAYILGALCILSRKTIYFWGVLVLIYIVWGMFFRYYEKRKPYFSWEALFNSLLPSTKIVMLTVIIGLVLIFLPFIPIFVSTSAEFSERYLRFLQGNFEDRDMLAAIANVLFVLVSPVVAYRPFLAWISCLNGRSGSLKQAWEKTKGNYFEFLVIAIMTSLSISFVHWCVFELGGNDFITLFFVAPVVIYFNVIAAKAYDFFFLDKK